MQLYHYAPETGAYAGTSEARRDPVEEEHRLADGRPETDIVWLRPAYTTDIAPPTAGDNAIAVFDGESWSLMPDYQGVTVWRSPSESYVIEAPGIAPLPSETAEPPPTVPDGKVLTLTAGEWQLEDEPEAPLEELAIAAIGRINAGYEQAIRAILAEYPEAETLSFDKQEREARAWSAWNGAPESAAEPATPYIDAMLSTRPLTKADLVARIIGRANAFIQIHGAATGQRQALEDEVDSALEREDRAALEAITWDTDTTTEETA